MGSVGKSDCAEMDCVGVSDFVVLGRSFFDADERADIAVEVDIDQRDAPVKSVGIDSVDPQDLGINTVSLRVELIPEIEDFAVVRFAPVNDHSLFEIKYRRC